MQKVKTKKKLIALYRGISAIFSLPYRKEALYAGRSAFFSSHYRKLIRNPTVVCNLKPDS